MSFKKAFLLALSGFVFMITSCKKKDNPSPQSNPVPSGIYSGIMDLILQINHYSALDTVIFINSHVFRNPVMYHDYPTDQVSNFTANGLIFDNMPDYYECIYNADSSGVNMSYAKFAKDVTYSFSDNTIGQFNYTDSQALPAVQGQFTLPSTVSHQSPLVIQIPTVMNCDSIYISLYTAINGGYGGYEGYDQMLPGNSTGIIIDTVHFKPNNTYNVTVQFRHEKLDTINSKIYIFRKSLDYNKIVTITP